MTAATSIAANTKYEAAVEYLHTNTARFSRLSMQMARASNKSLSFSEHCQLSRYWILVKDDPHLHFRVQVRYSRFVKAIIAACGQARVVREKFTAEVNRLILESKGVNSAEERSAYYYLVIYTKLAEDAIVSFVVSKYQKTDFTPYQRWVANEAERMITPLPKDRLPEAQRSSDIIKKMEQTLERNLKVFSEIAPFPLTIFSRCCQLIKAMFKASGKKNPGVDILIEEYWCLTEAHPSYHEKNVQRFQEIFTRLIDASKRMQNVDDLKKAYCLEVERLVNEISSCEDALPLRYLHFYIVLVYESAIAYIVNENGVWQSIAYTPFQALVVEELRSIVSDKTATVDGSGLLSRIEKFLKVADYS